MELRDDSEGGVGNIVDLLIKQGLVTATEEVYVQHNFSNYSNLHHNLFEFCFLCFGDKI